MDDVSEWTAKTIFTDLPLRRVKKELLANEIAGLVERCIPRGDTYWADATISVHIGEVKPFCDGWDLRVPVSVDIIGIRQPGTFTVDETQKVYQRADSYRTHHYVFVNTKTGGEESLQQIATRVVDVFVRGGFLQYVQACANIYTRCLQDRAEKGSK